MDQPATTTIAMTNIHLTPAGTIFENVVSKVAENCPHNLSTPFVCVGSGLRPMFTALACGLNECASYEIKTLSKKGRLALPRGFDFIDTFTLDVFPGETCEATLNAGILVPKDKFLRKEFLAGNDVGYEWVFGRKTHKVVFVPLAIAKNITHCNNTIKFFKTPIIMPKTITLSLSVECDRERERHVSIKQILVSGGPANIVTLNELDKNPLCELPIISMLKSAETHHHQKATN